MSEQTDLQRLAEAALGRIEQIRAVAAESEAIGPQPPKPRRLQELDQASLDRCEQVFGSRVRQYRDLVAREERAEGAERRRLKQEADDLLVELLEVLAGRNSEGLFDRYPGIPVDCYETPANTDPVPTDWVRPGRRYLDVTDATLADVKRFWTFMEWRHKAGRRDGSTKARARGRQLGRSANAARWIERANEVGESAAREEYRSECLGDRRKFGRGEWPPFAQWWTRNVRSSAS